MIRPIRSAAAASFVVAIAAASLPAFAQYANQFTPAHLIKQGPSSKHIAGKGTVVVQVEIKPNGAHHATRVIRSTNRGDNAAAMEIANSSTYRPAHRGTKPILSLYDFTLHFTGSGVAESGTAEGAGGPAARIDRLLRAGKYGAAKAAAQRALGNAPSNPLLNEELGAANYFMADYPSAAAAFSNVASPTPEFAQVAAQSYQMASEKMETSAPAKAVQYGQKAVTMSPTTGSYFALGSAQLAAGDTANATINLKKARDMAFADGKTSTKDRVAIDSQLLQAYIKAGDMANVQTTANEIKRLDPTSTAAQMAVANEYLLAGNAASKAGNNDAALSDYERAAATGVPDAQVTGNINAAFLESRLTKPDYTKMKAYADKALAARSTDPTANYAEGIALYGEYVAGNGTNPDLKTQAIAALNKAKAEAQAANDTQLLTNINGFMKQSIK